jgi:hypothetical protein
LQILGQPCEFYLLVRAGCEFLTCVDAYTAENGATWLVPGSRDNNSPPPPSATDEHPDGAEQLIAPAGTVLIFVRAARTAQLPINQCTILYCLSVQKRIYVRTLSSSS